MEGKQKKVAQEGSRVKRRRRRRRKRERRRERRNSYVRFLRSCNIRNSREAKIPSLLLASGCCEEEARRCTPSTK